MILNPSSVLAPGACYILKGREHLWCVLGSVHLRRFSKSLLVFPSNKVQF